jgi:hypothetical protein
MSRPAQEEGGVETGESALAPEGKGLNFSTSNTREAETLQEEINKLGGKVDKLEVQIDGVETKIQAVEAEIKQCECSAANDDDKAYYRQKESALRQEKSKKGVRRDTLLDELRQEQRTERRGSSRKQVQGLRALTQHLSAVNLQADDSPPRTMTAGYEANVGNGIEEDKYVKRTVADEIVQCVITKPNRLLLRGAPASGKTSIMGDVFRQLCQRYEGKSTNVYYLNATKIPNESKRCEVENWIGGQSDIVVLVDDAQRLYERPSFFELFKGGNCSLIAAASYSPDSVNPDTPLNLQHYESHVDDEELPRVFALLGLTNESAEMKQLEMWFGRSFGRIFLLGGHLLTLWRAYRIEHPEETLEHFYYQAATLHQLFQDRVLPQITDELRAQIKAHYLGRLDPKARKQMASYGILRDDGQWTCDYVERFYFSKVFHAEELQKNLFAEGRFPSCSELLYIGLSEIDWTAVQQCRESSKDAKLPIEDTWQTHFYMGVGKYIPQNMVFCKERASSGGKLDFMLRNGRKLGIELLIESRGVAEHHARFAGNGQYVDLKLDQFLVCDIMVGDESSEAVPHRVTASFSKAGSEECKSAHSVFWVNRALSSGMLYLYDGQQIQKANLLFASQV